MIRVEWRLDPTEKTVHTSLSYFLADSFLASTTVLSEENKSTKSNRGPVLTRSWPTTNFSQSTSFTQKLPSTKRPFVGKAPYWPG